MVLHPSYIMEKFSGASGSQFIENIEIKTLRVLKSALNSTTKSQLSTTLRNKAFENKESMNAPLHMMYLVLARTITIRQFFIRIR